MATVRKIGEGGVFDFEFTIDGRFGTGETHSQKESRFESELQACCVNDPEFATYVRKYHKGYGKGIHLGRCA